MTKAILMATTGAAAMLAVLAAGFAAGKAPPADPAAAAMATTTDTIAMASTEAAAIGSLDRSEVENIVRDYLLNNPEILFEVQDALEAKQKEEQRLASEGAIRDHKDEIFNSTFDGIVGNPDGKVTIVEFYDYNCGFCKRALADMLALTQENPDLRFVLKELPILGPDSHKASVVSMAFHKMMPDKYGAFHTALLGGEGRATEDRAIAIAVEFGADEAMLRQRMQDADISEAISKTYEIANRLSITGTPSYVVGNEVVFGALGQEVLAEKIKAAKAAL